MKTLKLNGDFETRNDKGELHSFDDKPAVSRLYGYECWYKEGKVHRIGGPAMIEYAASLWWYSKSWWKEGKFHRLDGPAVEYSNNTKEWWYEGREVKCDFLEEFHRMIKFKAFW